MPFIDRTDAGRRLAQRLLHLRGRDAVALGIPRGGVPVAFEVAETLGIPLDVIMVRKLGVPFQPELGLGAIGEGGIRVINGEVMRAAQVTDDEVAAIEARERVELERRADLYRGARGKVPLGRRTAIVIDDGIATGSTALAACEVARARRAAHVVLAAPVASPSVVDRLRGHVDEVVCVEMPEPLFAIGEWYTDFSQTSDAEVGELLERAANPLPAEPTAGARAVGQAPVMHVEDVEIGSSDHATLRGRLSLPHGLSGLVVFAHGSGSSRHSPRNQFVAAVLNQARLGTLLFDLLTPDEERDRGNVFDVELLARRLLDATEWLRARAATRDLPIGYFGASTGAAAALWAAAEPGVDVSAVVSRGGRPDLAWQRLSRVRAPTLLIVGQRDEVVLEMNRRVHDRLLCQSRVVVVPGATHLFEEPGTLELAARQARDWFLTWLVSRPEHVRDQRAQATSR